MRSLWCVLRLHPWCPGVRLVRRNGYAPCECGCRHGEAGEE